MSADVRPYAVLARALLDGRLAAEEFQAVLVPLFKADRSWRDDQTYAVINAMFLATEAYDPTRADATGPYRATADDIRTTATAAIKHFDRTPEDR